MNRTEKIKFIALAFVVGILGGAFSYLMIPAKNKAGKSEKIVSQTAPTTTNVRYVSNSGELTELPDFTVAAQKGLNAVVHIKTEYYNDMDDPVYNFFFGRPNAAPALQGSGSGVIISKDGYIVTNNHVIDKATNITVTLNDKREFKAKIIGRDPTTDIALLKIDADSLHTIPFGNSDNLKVGQWVLAIGNPFNLTSTVTAGIVSAKGRNININDRKYAIESFIQTDAAVNPGNSGGALINTDGQLVGINTAIASPTGTFTGYSFAIPVSIVKKVVADLIEYGAPQRAYLGVKVADINDKVAQAFNLHSRKGIVVTSVVPDGAAAVAGLKQGDVITKFDGVSINEVPELLEHIGIHRPGDKVPITIRRNNRIYNYTVTLKNDEGNTTIIKRETTDVFGASFENITPEELSKYGLRNGVRVTDVMSGKFLSAGIRPGFVIVKINGKSVRSVDDVSKILSNVHGGVYIEGFYPETGMKAYYAFGVE
jgi:Do/DeqQ family serine protease